jgi:7-carboxy-7-deazaguanine synthase
VRYLYRSLHWQEDESNDSQSGAVYVSFCAMSAETLNVCETFTSLQGESSYAGMGCHFIRLSGCNLRCRYCDSRYAFEEAGKAVALESLVNVARASRVPLIEVTGGEPLLQSATPLLLKQLAAISDRTVLVETNGSMDISVIPETVVAIVDIKCPGSHESESFDRRNLDRLRPLDELKFVITSRDDYEWSCRFIQDTKAAEKVSVVHFSPVVTEGLHAETLATWIVEDALPVRLQLQLHRILKMR